VCMCVCVCVYLCACRSECVRMCVHVCISLCACVCTRAIRLIGFYRSMIVCLIYIGCIWNDLFGSYRSTIE